MLSLSKNLSELITFDAKTGSVSSRESKRIEFKEGFIAADLSDYTKVLASFANSLGGVIIFGVSNKPRTIVGAKGMADEADWANRLRDDFDPEIPFAIAEYKVGGHLLYAVGVDASQHKPVICRKSRSKVIEKKGEKKDVMIVQESAIYYRYAGQTRPINFPELHNMLTERDAMNTRKFMQTLQLVEKIGLDNTGVLDMSDPKPSILMSPETAKGLNFIKKAELVEEKGAPAYMVVGQVDLQHVVHAPLEDEDKNLPTEAAKLLAPVVKEVFGTKFSAQQLTQLLRHMKIDGDNHHCVYEKKMGRKYITRAGLKAAEEYIRKNPAEAIEAFGTKAAKSAFGSDKLKTMTISEILVPADDLLTEVMTTGKEFAQS